jgi:hypothetical protein
MMRCQISSWIVSVLVGSVISASLWGQMPDTSDPKGLPLADEKQWFAAVSLCQSSALRKDPALLPKIEAIFQYRYDTRTRHGLTVNALVTIGRIGGSEALALLERLETILRKPHFYSGAYYREQYLPVIKARIQADLAFPQVRNSEQWQQKVELFLQEAELTREALQEALHKHPPRGDPMVYPSRGVVAVRVLLELASEAYGNGVKEALQLFEGLALERDYPSWLRYQLAPLEVKQRVRWLIDSLTHKRAMRFVDQYELLALWQCGSVALPEILAKIEELSKLNPKEEEEKVRVNIGLTNMLEVLAGYEDPRVEPLLERFAQAGQFKAEELLRRHRQGLRGIIIFDW